MHQLMMGPVVNVSLIVCGVCYQLPYPLLLK